MFLFTLGVKIGPGLVNVLLSRASLKYLIICLFSGGLLTAAFLLTANFFGLSNVVTGGLAAGAMTTSAALAASQAAVSSGGIGLPAGMQAEQAANLLGSAYAITCLYGTFGVIVLLKLCPKLVGKNIAKGIADLEAGAATRDADKRLPTLIEKVLRDGQPLPLDSDLKLQEGDVVAVWATPGVLVVGSEVIGEEVTDHAALAVELLSAELVLTNKEFEGRTLADLVRNHGRGVSVERMVRQGNDLPLRGDLELVRGDVVFVSGPTRQVKRFAEVVGYLVTDQLVTDLVSLGLFLAVFGALGTISLDVMGITLSILGGVPIGAGRRCTGFPWPRAVHRRRGNWRRRHPDRGPQDVWAQPDSRRRDLRCNDKRRRNRRSDQGLKELCTGDRLRLAQLPEQRHLHYCRPRRDEACLT